MKKQLFKLLLWCKNCKCKFEELFINTKRNLRYISDKVTGGEKYEATQ